MSCCLEHNLLDKHVAQVPMSTPATPSCPPPLQPQRPDFVLGTDTAATQGYEHIIQVSNCHVVRVVLAIRLGYLVNLTLAHTLAHRRYQCFVPVLHGVLSHWIVW